MLHGGERLRHIHGNGVAAQPLPDIDIVVVLHDADPQTLAVRSAADLPLVVGDGSPAGLKNGQTRKAAFLLHHILPIIQMVQCHCVRLRIVLDQHGHIKHAQAFHAARQYGDVDQRKLNGAHLDILNAVGWRRQGAVGMDLDLIAPVCLFRDQFRKLFTAQAIGGIRGILCGHFPHNSLTRGGAFSGRIPRLHTAAADAGQQDAGNRQHKR